jgi:hypothetical protein
MKVKKGFRGATLMLADHFSVPFDAEDGIHSLFRLPIAGKTAAAVQTAVEEGRWFDLELRWDSTKRTCEATVDGRLIATMPQQHESDGPSYLRIRCNAVAPEEGRLLLNRVEMRASVSLESRPADSRSR